MDHLDIRLVPHGNWATVDLLVNGALLQSLLAEYEEGLGFEPAGGYASISLNGLQPAESRLRGHPEDWALDGDTLLLVCEECREEACQPMFAHIVRGETDVQWTAFRGERPERDYAGLHFTFDRREYDRAVTEAFGER